MIMPIFAVANVNTSVEFYRDTLGFTVGVMMPLDGNNLNFAIVDQSPTVHIGLTLDNGTYDRGKGVVFMLYVPDDLDLDAYYADVQSKGVTIVEELREEYWGDKLFSITDPDGYYLQFCRTVKQMTVEEIAANAPTPEAN